MSRATIRKPTGAESLLDGARLTRPCHHSLMPRSPIDRLRRLCLSLPDAYEKLSHGEPTFWAGKRMFASFADAANHHGAGRHAVWCKATHITQRLLIDKDPNRYFNPPYAGPAGWVGVYLDRAPDWKDVEDRLKHAHELAASASKPRARKRAPRKTR